MAFKTLLYIFFQIDIYMNAVLISSTTTTQAGLNIQPTKRAKELLQVLREIEQQTGFLCSCTLLFSRVWLISVTLLQSKQTSCRQERQMSCNQRRPEPRAEKERAELCVRAVSPVCGLRDVQAEQEWLFPKAFSLHTWCLCSAPLIRRKEGDGRRLHQAALFSGVSFNLHYLTELAVLGLCILQSIR